MFGVLCRARAFYDLKQLVFWRWITFKLGPGADPRLGKGFGRRSEDRNPPDGAPVRGLGDEVTQKLVTFCKLSCNDVYSEKGKTIFVNSALWALVLCSAGRRNGFTNEPSASASAVWSSEWNLGKQFLAPTLFTISGSIDKQKTYIYKQVNTIDTKTRMWTNAQREKTERKKKERRKKEEENTGWKYNGPPYSIGRP